MKIKAIARGADGSTIDISQFVGDISLSGSIKESTKTMDLKTLRADVDKSFDGYNVNLGDTLNFYDLSDGKGEEFFQGVVWAKATDDTSVDLSLTLYDSAIYLNKNESKTQVFTNKKADDVARVVLSELGLSIGELASTGAYNFNLRGLNGYDAIMAAYTKDSEKTGKQYRLVSDKGRISVYEAGKEHPITIEDLEEPVVGKIIGLSYKESMDELVNEVKAIDDKKKDEKKEVKVDPASQARYGRIQKVLKGDSKDLAGLMKGARQEVDVRCIGDWDMVAGKSINLESKIVSGKFYIESDRHSLDDGKHIVDLKLVSELEMDKKEEGAS